MNAMMLSCVKATEFKEMKEHVPVGFSKNYATEYAHRHVSRLQKLYEAEPVN